MTDVREVIRRLHVGEPDRRIARELGVSRNTVASYRRWAERQNLLNGSLPDAATVAALLRPPARERPPHEQSCVAPFRDQVRRNEVRGTWLDSHFGWQLRTFWFAALWIVVIGVICTPLILLFGLGLILMWIDIAFVGLWILYRVVRGWLALKDGRTV